MLSEPIFDLRQSLKSATAREHSALEKLIGRLDDHSAYRRYARGMHAFRTSIEGCLCTASALVEWRPQCLSDELTRDLTDIGAIPLARTVEFSHAARTTPFTLGVLYVLEGSALGARLLCKQVEALGLTHQYGARHLWKQAASLEPWRAFVGLLQRRTPGEVEEMAAGANAAFATAAAAMKAAHG